jgi:hypothetical protein
MVAVVGCWWRLRKGGGGGAALRMVVVAGGVNCKPMQFWQGWPDVRLVADGRWLPDVRCVTGRPVRGGCRGGSGRTLVRAKIRETAENSWIFEGYFGGDGGGKIDLLETQQLHGSKPTNSHLFNKSQKNLGLFLWGNFRN